MNYAILTLIVAILASPVPASSQGTNATPIAGSDHRATIEGPSSPDETSPIAESTLLVQGKNAGTEPEDFRYKLGETLGIVATGEIAEKIESELTEPGKSGMLHLYMNGIRMNNLRRAETQSSDRGALRVTFFLARDSNDDADRADWDTLLKRKTPGYLPVQLSLSVGDAVPMSVRSRFPVTFYVATPTLIWVVFGLGIVFFLISFILLMNSGVIRDTQTGRYSLGKTQMAFWTLIVVLSFVGVWILTGSMERISPQVLILMGISAGTALGARVIDDGNRRKQADESRSAREEICRLEKTVAGLQAVQNRTDPQDEALGTALCRLEELKVGHGAKRSPRSSKPRFFTDLVDDGNGLSLHRLQVVIWTVVLGCIFVQSVMKVISMPEFPETLLTLMGISNGTYAGFKLTEEPK